MVADYIAYNGPMTTTAPPVAVTTGTATKTLMQLTTAANNPIEVWKWGIQFNGTGTAPITVELIETGAVAATTNMTAYASTALQPLLANQSPSSLVLTSAASGYSGATAPVEGTITATRYGDLQWIYPGNYYQNEFSLGRGFFVPGGRTVRIRVTASAAVSAVCYLVWNE